ELGEHPVGDGELRVERDRLLEPGDGRLAVALVLEVHRRIVQLMGCRHGSRSRGSGFDPIRRLASRAGRSGRLNCRGASGRFASVGLRGGRELTPAIGSAYNPSPSRGGTLPRRAIRSLGAPAMLLAYDDYGPGPVVVLLHGFPLNRSMWSAQETSVGSIYRVIAPDLRGHGESAAPEGVYTIDGMADDVIELLDALQLREPVVLGGLSMGGCRALPLIVRYPGRFRALRRMDPRPTADSPDAARNREDLASKVEASGNAGHVVEAMWPKMVSDATRRRRAELLGPLR